LISSAADYRRLTPRRRIDDHPNRSDRQLLVQRPPPGPTATKLFLDGKPQEVIDRLSKMAPLERLGQPQDIADVVAFLVGPDGAWINGQTLRANGGII
jgi:3-oxoacyl-[acyl-carrier protein] reductase